MPRPAPYGVEQAGTRCRWSNTRPAAHIQGDHPGFPKHVPTGPEAAAVAYR
jgi:hypothetical protein